MFKDLFFQENGRLQANNKLINKKPKYEAVRDILIEVIPYWEKYSIAI